MGTILTKKPSFAPVSAPWSADVLPQAQFLRMLYLERKRVERSRSRFILMLLESSRLADSGRDSDFCERICLALSRSTRETDLKGWYRDGEVLGVIFTEVHNAEGRVVANALLGKVSDALRSVLSLEHSNQISLSFHVFPEDWADGSSSGPSSSTVLMDLLRGGKPARAPLAVKRAMDMLGSSLALLLWLPFFLLIAVAIKLTSKGPVFFRQQRMGQYGKPFTFLKFRSMFNRNDHSVHREYIKQFISGTEDCQQAGAGPAAYKLAADPRITPLGRFLRKTSLDELPQFFNVLMGDMSLVGPRPPIPYEFESYDVWHKRRLLEVKPGMTGLWQVEGRSKVKFDDMVRMDLRYARTWSLLLDIKILLQTPRAVFSTDGAR